MPEPRRTLVAIAAGLVLASCGTRAAPDQTADRPTAQQEAPNWAPSTESAGVPERLKIPDLGVDAEVLALGKAADGSQDVPPTLGATSWWRNGSKPGEPGNTVIVGHTSSKSDGVFDRLGTLRRGDRITVRARDGSFGYAVTETSEVQVEKFTKVSESIYRETGPSGLVLMTCGDWNGRDFDTTVIVRAVADAG